MTKRPFEIKREIEREATTLLRDFWADAIEEAYDTPYGNCGLRETTRQRGILADKVERFCKSQSTQHGKAVAGQLEIISSSPLFLKRTLNI